MDQYVHTMLELWSFLVVARRFFRAVHLLKPELFIWKGTHTEVKPNITLFN